MTSPLPPIDYTSRDYASFRQDLIDAIPSRLPEWTSRSPNDFGMILIECLVAGTLVATPAGSVPIEKIQTGQPVLNAAGVGVVARTRTVEKTRLVEVVVDGEPFFCSEEHPFFTTRGWIAAACLEQGEEILTHEAAVRILRGESGGGEKDSRAASSKVLQHELLQELQPSEAHPHLRRVRDPVLRSVDDGSLRSSVLLTSMFGKGQTDSSEPSSEVSHLPYALHSQDSVRVGGKSAILFSEVPSRVGPGQQNMDAPQHGGGTRGVIPRPVQPVAGIGRWLVSAVLGLTAWGNARDGLLHDRRGRSSGDGRRRSGRAKSLWEKKTAGPGPSALAGVHRVDCVSVHEQGSEVFSHFSSGEGTVTLHDLTVTGHPSFVVGEQQLLVHNCFAYMGDTLSFYGDRIANEAFLETAVLRSSVLKIAAMLDYRPTGTLASETMLQFTLATGTASTVIPANTKLSTMPIEGEEPIIFETLEELTIPGTSVGPVVYFGSIGARQGKTYSAELLGESTGGVDQEFSLFYSPVIADSVKVFVDEAVAPIEWRYFTQLIDAGPSDNAFTTISDENNIERVRFGDDVNGRTPPIGSIITTTYRVGGGARGNVGPGTVTQFIDVIGNVIAVTNLSQAQGGADAETIDEIRQNAPRALTTIDRAVTLEDYASVAIKHTGVAKARADALVYTNITLYIAPFGGGIATAALREDVQRYIDARKMVNATVSLTNPVYVPINITVNVQVLARYNQLTVKDQVEKALKFLLSFEQVGFGHRVTISDVYRTISGVDGVDYAVVTRVSRTSAGLSDVQLATNEIPDIGSVTVVADGGIVL